MELDEFVSAFAAQFDETEEDAFAPSTLYHELDEWSSLLGLAIMNMVAMKTGVKITPAELRESQTIEDLFRKIESKIR